MSQMNASDRPVEGGLLSRVFSWLVTHHVREGEVANLSRGDMSELARDLGVSQSDLLTAFPNGVNSRDLMDQMIRAHGLEPGQVRSISAAMARDLEATCSRCGSKARCQRDLKAGTAAAHCHEYCGNAEVFEAIASGQRHS